jgi:hypothetical protein
MQRGTSHDVYVIVQLMISMLQHHNKLQIICCSHVSVCIHLMQTLCPMQRQASCSGDHPCEELLGTTAPYHCPAAVQRTGAVAASPPTPSRLTVRCAGHATPT